jgi:hypothetical protein
VEVWPVLLGVALVAGVAVFALLPLVHGSALGEAVAPRAEDPGARRLQLYRTVLDLEFDYQTGKLSLADYQALSAELLAQAGEQLRASRDREDDLDAQIEREIAAARKAFAASRAAAGLAGDQRASAGSPGASGDEAMRR